LRSKRLKDVLKDVLKGELKDVLKGTMRSGYAGQTGTAGE